MSVSTRLPAILYVDDEEDNLIVFNSAFRRNYEIHLAKSGLEGLEIMKNHSIQLIITDQRMPEMTGIQFLEKIIPDYPDCIRMILTGFSDIEAIIQAINTGRVYRYITKPWSKEELKINIDKGLETYHLREQNRNLIADLKEANLTLEEKVIERTKKIEEQNREITDSIQYASRIQRALLPPDKNFEKLFSDYFILNKPRDIVSGDFYLLVQKDDKVIVAASDSTGHGIPGAFMSILGISLLNEVINKTAVLKSDEILKQMRIQLVKALHQSGSQKDTKDGMEMGLSIFDFNKRTMEYSGAFRPLYIIRGNNLIELKGDPIPIGIYPGDETSFACHEIEIKKDDLIFLSSDGYVDQIGGAERKTFRSGNFKDLLMKIHAKPMKEQMILLERSLEEWKGNIDQVDDILVLGLKIQ